jgi:multidrug efflux pump subunit AcrA (membrane-fusion protein)
VALLGAGALLASVLTGCTLLPKEEEALAPPLVKPVKENFDLYEVKRGNIAKTVAGVGTFASDKTDYLFFPASGGRLKSINIQLGDIVKPGDIVAQINSGDIETKIAQQELNIQKAQINLELAKSDKRGDVDQMKLKLIDVQSARLQLESLKQDLADTRLVSEIGGIVTFVDTTLKEGDQVTAFRPIINIADPSDMTLAYKVNNMADLTDVEINMDVDVKINNKPYIGHVVQIPATAAPSDNKAVQDRNSKTILIRVDNLPPDVKIGAHGDLVITTQAKDNVILIPRAGLRSYMGRNYVQVMEGDSRKEIDVETGIVAATDVEIVKGLQEGQQVILNN